MRDVQQPSNTTGGGTRPVNQGPLQLKAFAMLDMLAAAEAYFVISRKVIARASDGG